MQFQLLESQKIHSKDGKEYTILIVYCSTYQFLTRIFCTPEQVKKLSEKIKETNNYDITESVSVYYDSKLDKFKFSIK